MNHEHKDISKFLPFGEQLRGFVNQKFLSSTDLNRVLRERGVFVLNTDKNFTAPLLQTFLLSPREFDKIREAFSTKEDNHKIISRDIQWVEGSQLYSTDTLEIDVNDYIAQKRPTCTLKKPIRLVQVDGNPNHLRAEIAIKRNDLNKAWYEQTNDFEGFIEFMDDGGGKGRVQITHTAPEIKDIAEQAIKVQISKYKSKGVIPASEDLRKIIFRDFTNEDRFVFFLRLTNHLECAYFKFEDIKNLEMMPDEATLQEEIKWMENLTKIVLSGKSLDKKYFIEDRKYHTNLILWSMDASYFFEFKGHKGKVVFNFGFPDFKTNKGINAEFEMNISSLTIEAKIGSKDKNRLKSKLLSEMDKQKSSVYNNFLEYKNKKNEQ